MRKLTYGNQKIFIVFSIIIIVIVALLIWEIIKIVSISSVKYDVSKGMIFYDKDLNLVMLSEDGKVYKKWNNNYYLNLNDSNKEYVLGENGIGYYPGIMSLNIFGKLFKVNYDNTVEKYTDQTVIKNLNKNALYKLDDRKYLVVGRTIKNDTESILAKNYLIIILDKYGNTLLLNNELNYRTINPMKIITSDFKFDIPNEKLIYNKDADTVIEIDLKKIIGSSNEYVEKEIVEEEKEEEQEDVLEEEEEISVNNNNNNSQIIQETSTVETATQTKIIGSSSIAKENNNSTNIIASEKSSSKIDKSDKTEKVEDNDTNDSTTTKQNNDNSKENNNKTKIVKSINLRQITAGSTSLDIDYYISDPENKYQTVYLEIESSNGYSEYISLDKSKTSYRVTGLEPNTEYKVSLRYKEISEENEIVDGIEDVLSISTLGINATIEITKISTNKIYFKFKMDNNYVFDSAVLNIYKDGELIDSLNVNVEESINSEGWQDYIERIFGYDTLTFKIEDIVYEGNKINYTTETKIKSY